MQTLTVVNKSTPVAVFHFIISNYVRWMEGTVKQISTTKTFAFMLFPGAKVPLRGQLYYPRGGGNSPWGELSWGRNSPGGIVRGGNCPGGIVVGQ